jgi:hypothetical protein
MIGSHRSTGALRQRQREPPQSGDGPEVLRIRRQQFEVMLDGLRGQPKIVDPYVRIPPRSPQSGGQRSEDVGGLHGDPELRLVTQPS